MWKFDVTCAYCFKLPPVLLYAFCGHGLTLETSGTKKTVAEKWS